MRRRGRRDASQTRVITIAPTEYEFVSKRRKDEANETNRTERTEQNSEIVGKNEGTRFANEPFRRGNEFVGYENDDEKRHRIIFPKSTPGRGGWYGEGGCLCRYTTAIQKRRERKRA